MKNILVIGSSNADITAFTPKFPVNGETVAGRTMITSVGGKGANQATAAARAGGNVTFITKVGKDSMAEMIFKSFTDDNINTDYVYSTAEAGTGSAFIEVNDTTGENRIICIAGANGEITPQEILYAEDAFRTADLVLIQLELETDRVLESVKLAKKYNIPVILNPAPAKELPEELYRMIDYFTPNESEASYYSGFSVTDEASAVKAAEILLSKGIKNVIITLGKKGSLFKNAHVCEKINAFSVKAVDTTGAGDSFNGGLAVALAEKRDISDAIRFASATAALSVTKEGASKSMPLKEDILRFLEKNRI